MSGLRAAASALGMAAMLCGSAEAAPGMGQAADGFLEDFQSVEVSKDGSVVSTIGRFVVEGEGALEVMSPRPWPEGELGLRLPGGEAMSTVMEVAPSCAFGGTLEFSCQRDGRRRPFLFEVVLVSQTGEEIVRDLTGQVNAKKLQSVVVDLQAGVTQVRFNVTAPSARGVWIDDLRFVPPTPMRLESAALQLRTRPLIHGERVEVGVLELLTVGGLNPLTLEDTTVEEDATDHSATSAPSETVPGEGSKISLMTAFTIGNQEAPLQLVSGINRVPVYVSIDLWASEDRVAAWSTAARYSASFTLGEERVTVSADSSVTVKPSWPAVRIMEAQTEVDGVSLVTTLPKDGSAAVLVAAISTPSGVVVKRSVDGGGTWMGVALGERAATLRMASLVLDIEAETLHLMAGRDDGLVHASSVDGGVTWTEFRVLGAIGTKRVAGAASSGVCMSTGELVFPCVIYGGFRIEDEPCAGVVYSNDGGFTWAMHGAAFANTSTSTAVEIGPGALLLNMADGRGAMRSERSTRDFGKTWRRRHRVALENIHRSAGGDGSMIHLGRARGTGWDGRLVFANADTERRPVRNMTLKGSSDNGSGWPEEHRVLLDDGVGVDHPSLVPVGSGEVGVAYSPSAGGVIFQRLPESVVVPAKASWFDVTGGR